MERNFKTFAFLFVFSVMLCGIAYGQTLSGEVRVGGKGVFAADIFLLQHPDIITISDENGHFELDLNDSLYSDSLVVRSLGYYDWQKCVSDISSYLVVELRPRVRHVDLESVVVRADPLVSKEFAAFRMTKESIYMTPASNADPLRAVSLLPCNTSTGESACPELRGSSSEQSKVFVNDVPIVNPVRNHQLNGIGNFSLFSAEVVGEQHVYPSNPPLEWGNSIGGVVDLKTQKNLIVDKETIVTLSSAAAGLFHSRKIGDSSFLQVYANAQESGLYKQMNAPHLAYLHGFSSFDGGINYRKAFSGKSFLNVYSYSISEKYRSNRGLYNYCGAQKASQKRCFHIVNYNRDLGKGVLSVNTSADLSQSNYHFSVIEDTAHVFRGFVSLSYKYTLNEGISLKIGADQTLCSVKNKGVYPSSLFNIYASEGISRKWKLYSDRTELFSYGKYSLGHFILGMGLRSVVVPNGRFSINANCKYQIGEHQSLLLSVGRYHSQMEPTQAVHHFSWASSKQFSCDWKWSSLNGAFGAALYVKNNSLPWQGDLLLSYPIKEEIIGGECYGKVNLGKFVGSGSYGYVYSQLQCNGNKYNGINDSGHMVKMQLSFMDESLINASLSFLYRGGLRYTPFNKVCDNETMEDLYNSAQHKPYFTLDFCANRYFSCRRMAFIPFLTIVNITNRLNPCYFYYDREYRHAYQKNYQKRLVYLGLSLRF